MPNVSNTVTIGSEGFILKETPETVYLFTPRIPLQRCFYK